MSADAVTPWNEGVRGEQVLPLINTDLPILRVPAGPGTGKTFGLRRRVLRLLHPDGEAVPPERVLVCTFNRVIAEDLRGEINAELAVHGLESPEVKTVHALAAGLGGELPRLLLPEEVEVMVYDVRCTHPDINEMYEGNQGKTLRALREHEAGLADHPALAAAVRQWLTDHGAGLIGDLPRHVETRLRNGDLGDRRYDHIIIDEFQDLTEIEIRLLLGLRSDKARLVVLGDRKQSIYAFRGNDGGGLEGLESMISEGEEIVDHRMDECQRCPSAIVDLANDLVAVYAEPLRDVQGGAGQIHQVHGTTPEEEHTRIAQEIVRVYRERPDDKHLVLATRRRWGYDIRNAIREIDPAIEAQTVFAEDVLETWPAREAFMFLSIVGDGNDAAALRDWVAYREPDAEGKNWKAANRNAGAYNDIRTSRGVLSVEKAAAIAEVEEKDLAGAGRRNLLGRLRRLFELLGELPEEGTTLEIVNHILDPGSWVTETTSDPDLARDDIERLQREVASMLEENPDLTVNDVARQLRNRIATRQPLGVTDEPGIKIVTLWGAKGLTADYVYITGLCDEALPGPFDENSTGLTLGEYELEQRRLLYVSLTRAKKVLVISRPTRIQRGRVAQLGLASRAAGTRWQQNLSQCRFFADVPPDHLPDSESTRAWGGIEID